MWNPLAALRRKVAETVLLGVNDGFQAALSEEDAPANLKELREAVAASLPRALPPAKDEDEDATPKRKRGA